MFYKCKILYSFPVLSGETVRVETIQKDSIITCYEKLETFQEIDWENLSEKDRNSIVEKLETNIQDGSSLKIFCMNEIKRNRIEEWNLTGRRHW